MGGSHFLGPIPWECLQLSHVESYPRRTYNISHQGFKVCIKGKEGMKTVRRRIPRPTTFWVVISMILTWLSSIALGENSQAPRIHTTLKGEVSGGKAFERAFGNEFLFRLQPFPHGWLVVVIDKRGTEDISRLTPPFHFVPNPREIEGWHFRNVDNSGPNTPGEKNVNAPGTVREFIFSPEVGRTIGEPEAKRNPTPDEIETVRRWGHGELRILDYRLRDLEPGKRASFEWMRFEVDLSWPVGR